MSKAAVRARQERESSLGSTRGLPLFAEAVYAGAVVCVIGVAVVTVPLGIWVGARHIRRFLRSERSGLAEMGADIKRGFRALTALGSVLLVAVCASAMSAFLAGVAEVPGARLIALANGIVIFVEVVTATVMASAWLPGVSWKSAVTRLAVPKLLRSCLWCGIAVICTLFMAWQLLPLLIAGAGLISLAAAATSLDD